MYTINLLETKWDAKVVNEELLNVKNIWYYSSFSSSFCVVAFCCWWRIQYTLQLMRALGLDSIKKAQCAPSDKFYWTVLKQTHDHVRVVKSPVFFDNTVLVHHTEHGYQHTTLRDGLDINLVPSSELEGGGGGGGFLFLKKFGLPP